MMTRVSRQPDGPVSNSLTAPPAACTFNGVPACPMALIEEVLNGDETVLWEGRPAVLPFFASSLASMAIGAVFLLATIGRLTIDASQALTDIFALLALSPFLAIGLVFAIAYPLYRLLVYVNLSYAITTKRVLFRRGIVAKEVLMLDFDQISHAVVDIGFVDVFLGLGRSGSLLLATRGSLGPEASGPQHADYVLAHVPRPYDVFKFFERAEYDVKTDLDYPNHLRPASNPGYRTAYTPPGPQ